MQFPLHGLAALLIAVTLAPQAAQATQWDTLGCTPQAVATGNHAHFTPPAAPFRWGYFGAQPFSAPAKWSRTYYREPMVWCASRQY